jgi:CRP-like cAMP-binding protein
MYIEGEVEIFVNGQLEDTVGPETTIGKLGLTDERKRIAAAVAKTNCRLVRLARPTLTSWFRTRLTSR